ncbi:MAG: pyruvate carboxylase subunit B [Polaribacter sp.]|jgi:pyruvate carboxylase subunit B
MGKEIKFCLVYRDMWQSSGKYMPKVDQLCEVAETIIDMGCFSRVETNGGGFEQINLLYGENPNNAVRKWTSPFNKAGIQTQMLERGLNAIRMSPVPADIRRLMFIVKKKQGTDISRSFDGLNNPENLRLSFEYAKEGGMVAQGALSLTFSPVHTVDYYINLADQYIELGAEEICIKDMAGIGRPASVGKIVKGIKSRHPDILVQYHGHSTPGLSVASALEAARAGAEYIDVGMSPLSWGTGHADLLTIHAMLKDDGFSVPDINKDAYMATRALTQKFIDDWLGYYINPQNRKMESLLIGPGLPGGMMGSLMSDMEKNISSLNKWLTKNNKPTMTESDLLLALFNEVEYAWPKMGYPPLVTPFSQYVKNVSLMNTIQMIKGKKRWSMIDENTWGMLMGRSGQLPASPSDEILALARAQDRKFFTGVPQDLYPDELELFAGKMDKNGWDYGEDDEELLEYAMHPAQYLDYRSGKAKENFEADLAKRKAAANQQSASVVVPAPVSTNAASPSPRTMNINVDGEQYKVQVSYENSNNDSTNSTASPTPQSIPEPATGTSATTPAGNTKEIVAPLEGKFFLTKDSHEVALKNGDNITTGETIGYIEAMKVINAITADQSGTIVEVVGRHGEDIEEDDVIFLIQ